MKTKLSQDSFKVLYMLTQGKFAYRAINRITKECGFDDKEHTRNILKGLIELNFIHTIDSRRPEDKIGTKKYSISDSGYKYLCESILKNDFSVLYQPTIER